MFYCREKELSDMNKRYAKNKFESEFGIMS